MKKFLFLIGFIFIALCSSAKTYHYYGLMDAYGNVQVEEDYSSKIDIDVRGRTLYYSMCGSDGNWVQGPYLTLWSTSPTYYFVMLGVNGSPLVGSIGISITKDESNLVWGMYGQVGGMVYIED